MPQPQLSSAQLLGSGLTADVYAWGAGRVLKLFFPRYAGPRVEREAAITCAVHAAGLPAPAVHAVVEVEGRRGIVLERVEGRSMVQAVQSRPWMLFAGTRQLAELHAQLHSLPAPAGLPGQRAVLGGKIDAAAALPAAERAQARDQLAALPDGDALCHGDFHPANIVLTARGPVIIDWETATRGHPLGDVARTSQLLRTADLPAGSPAHLRLLLAVARGLLHATYLRRYFQLRPASRADLEAWSLPTHASAAAWRDEAALGA